MERIGESRIAGKRLVCKRPQEPYEVVVLARACGWEPE
jgi:hypothetical protein